MTLGQRIRGLRKQKSLTQRQLAELAGIDFSYLSKIESGKLEHTPSVRTLQDIARALGVDELELMELADKLPSVLEPIARNQEALRFFRKATETIKTSEGWRDLLDYLERHSDE
jgi:HTH-type transcriptional regulator, competence development regulator